MTLFAQSHRDTLFPLQKNKYVCILLYRNAFIVLRVEYVITTNKTGSLDGLLIACMYVWCVCVTTRSLGLHVEKLLRVEFAT